jgi:hypothetical protein
LRIGPIVVLAAAASLAACASAPPAPQTLHPYKVVLLPVEGSSAALAGEPRQDDVPLAMTPEALDTQITDRVKSSHVFSDVVVARSADLAVRGSSDEMQAASELARRTSSDLILRIVVKSARMTDLGNNGNTFWSTLTWFMLGFPSFWVDDRTYETDIAVQAELYDPADPVKPTASVVASSGKQDLDLWDRGLTAYVIVIPPAFLKGSAENVSAALTDRAVAQVMDALVVELRTREIPSRFEMDVVEVPNMGAPSVRVTIASRRRLRSLAVETDGKLVETWAESGLVEDKDSTPDRFSYHREVVVPAPVGARVRVIAEDEGGGREVRTLVIGGVKP